MILSEWGLIARIHTITFIVIRSMNLSIIRVNVLTLKGYECTYIDLNSEFKQVIKYFSDWNLLIDYIKTILPK